MFDFSGRTVLITGASYGLGEGFATAFAAAGADLVLTARSAELLESVADACRQQGAVVTAVAGDVSVEADVARVVAAGRRGARPHRRARQQRRRQRPARGRARSSFDMETWKRIIAVDLNGAFMYLRDVGRHMLERGGGSIVNICSIMGHGANELNVIAYTAAKGALRNLTLQLGCEWADRGVRVNSVSPGFIVTEMTRAGTGGPGHDDVDRQPHADAPGRASCDEIVDPVLFLASDAAGYITGHDLNVDGGTNAANGYFQIPPIHHEWNADTPRVGEAYAGIAPRPDWYQALAPGIPGIHY